MITPGDWFLVENRAGGRITSYSIEVPETDEQQDVLIGEVYGPTFDDMEDNARLIAAAPAMLEALRAIAGGHITQGDSTSAATVQAALAAGDRMGFQGAITLWAQKTARAAIATATGEESDNG